MHDEKRKKRRWNPPTIAYMILLHTAALGSLFLPIHWYYIPISIGIYLFMGFGITVGYHRLITHRSFSCPKWLEYFFATGAAVAGQGSPLLWVATHRIHHGRSDLEGDIHSPRKGFWYSHMGWVCDRAACDPQAWRKYCKDIADDRYYHFLLKYRMLPQAVVIAGIGLTLGPEAIPFVFCLTLVIMMHATFSVNSICHLPRFGSRLFETKDRSRNVLGVGIMALGEGWHNNHHAMPRSVKHGIGRGQLDLSYLLIRGLARLGLAWDLHMPELHQDRISKVA